MPEKSRGEKPACDLGILLMGGVCANVDTVNITTAIREKLARIHLKLNFTH